MIGAIPQHWKDKLTETSHRKLSDDDRNEAPFIQFRNQCYSIAQVQSRHFYSDEIKLKTPKSVERWEELGHTDMEWERIFLIPYRCTKSTKLQALQYRILHRYVPTKRYLYIRRLSESPQCLQCRGEDTLEHFLYQCSNVERIWIKIFSGLGIATQNGLSHVIFGILDERSSINLVILLVKQYIVSCKLSHDQIEPKFEGARATLNHHVQLEKHNAIVNNAVKAFTDKWRGLLDENDQIKI